MGILKKWLEKRVQEKEQKRELDHSKAMVEADITRAMKALAQAEEKYAKLIQIRDIGFLDKDYFQIWNPTTVQELQTNPNALDLAISEAKNDCARWRLSLNTYEKNFVMLRPNTKEDIAEREWVRDNFAKSLQEFDTTNTCDLRFHATSIVATKDIIQSGGIISAVDRLDGYATSSDPAGIISVSKKEKIQDSVNFWLDLNGYQGNRPCGCVFVVQPRTAEESAMISARQMNNVMFMEHPEQLIAIATTRENIDMVQSWLDAAGIDKPIVCQFEDLAFLLEMQREDIKAPYVVPITPDKDIIVPPENQTQDNDVR